MPCPLISIEGAVEHKLMLRVEDLAKFYPARRAAELPASLLSEANAATTKAGFH